MGIIHQVSDRREKNELVSFRISVDCGPIDRRKPAL